MKKPRSKRAVAFRPTGRAEHPYEADVDGRRWTIRVNDFPEEPLFSLLIDGEAVEDLEDWPSAWERPSPS